jgi:hypothetical protein
MLLADAGADAGRCGCSLPGDRGPRIADLASVSWTLPLRVRRRNRVCGERASHTVMKIIRTLEDKVVIIFVECYGKLVEKALGPQHSLEWHLKLRAPGESNSGCPLVFRIHRQRKMDVLELDGPVTAEHPDHASLSTRVAKADANRVRSASVEDRDRGSGINKSAKCPIAGRAVFQAHVNSRPKDGRVALLPIRKETIHGARLADAYNNVVRIGSDELSHGAATRIAELLDLRYQVTRVVGCGNHFTVLDGYPHSCPALQTRQGTLRLHPPHATSTAHTTKVSQAPGDAP